MKQSLNHPMLSLPVLINLLNEKYLYKFNTVIVGGFNEPFYKSFNHDNCAEIQFTRDYIRSALHELSHWCVAGVERRKLDDFGYWYAEDGRNQKQQDAFYKAEIKPQVIEWAFSIVAGVKFEASIDNLHTFVVGAEDFKQKLAAELKNHITEGFSPRVTDILQIIADEQKIKNPKAFIETQIGKK